jgi:hypothetical protein
VPNVLVGGNKNGGGLKLIFLLAAAHDSRALDSRYVHLGFFTTD